MAQNEVQTNFFSFSFFHNMQFRMCVYLEKKPTALTGLAGAPGQFLFTKGHFLTDSAMSGTPLIPKCLVCQKGCAPQKVWGLDHLFECSAPGQSFRQNLSAGSAINKLGNLFCK